jgi:hypothetical protein
MSLRLSLKLSDSVSVKVEVSKVLLWPDSTGSSTGEVA